MNEKDEQSELVDNESFGVSIYVRTVISKFILKFSLCKKTKLNSPLMATIEQVIADVRRQLSGMQITDSTRLNPNHIYFVASYTASELQADDIKQEMATFGRNRIVYDDHSLLVQKTIKIDCETMTAQLPNSPIAVPGYDYGLRGAFVWDEECGQYRGIKIVSPRESVVSSHVWWSNPKVIRYGNKLKFLNMPPVEEVIIYMISTEIPLDEFGEPDITAEFPCPEELLGKVIDLTIKRLTRASFIPEDSINDNKDTRPAQ